MCATIRCGSISRPKREATTSAIASRRRRYVCTSRFRYSSWAMSSAPSARRNSPWGRWISAVKRRRTSEISMPYPYKPLLIGALCTFGLFQGGVHQLFKPFIRGSAAERIAVHEKGRGRVDTGLLSGLHICINSGSGFAGIETGRKLLHIQFQFLRKFFEVIHLQACRREELIVVGPEFLLFSRTLSRFSSLLGLRVDIAQREIPEDKFDFALIRCHELLQGALGLTAVGTLKIGKFDDRDRRIGWPQGRLAFGRDLHRGSPQGDGHRVTRLKFLQ